MGSPDRKEFYVQLITEPPEAKRGIIHKVPETEEQKTVTKFLLTHCGIHVPYSYDVFLCAETPEKNMQ